MGKFNKILIYAIILFSLIPGLLLVPCLEAITMEKNTLTDGLVLVFPELSNAEGPYIDFDRSGDRRYESGVPEIAWDRPGSGQGIIQAQEILDLVVYKNNFRYLSVKQLTEVKQLLDKVGSITASDQQAIMTKKVARSYGDEINGLLTMRSNLADLVTKNEIKRVTDELKEVMARMSKQYAEEADKEASGTFKQDVEKFKAGVEVMMKAEANSPIEFPFGEFDDEKGTAKNSMVRIISDEVKNHNQRYINNKQAIFAIGKMGGRNAQNMLVSILQDPKYSGDADAIIEALGIIGEECTPEAVDRIGSYLDTSKDPKVKEAAIKTLGRVSSKKAIGILKKYVENPPRGMGNLRYFALKALVDIAENERKKGISSMELLPVFNEYLKEEDLMQMALAIKGIGLVRNLIPFVSSNT